jgi:DNA-binding transcriptional ArsR family regulator
MRDEIDLAGLAALIADPARARMLTAVMSGIALTATELAMEAGIAASTASTHLAKLTSGQILAIEKQGRHRYFRIFDAEVAAMLEELMEIASRRGPRRRIGPADPSLRLARVCYDHLAGERGVWLLDRLRERRIVDHRLQLSGDAEPFFATLGIDIAPLEKSRRPLCRPCLDWSERRHHLGGALGAAILDRIFALRWARREVVGRVVVFSASGERAMRQLFGLNVRLRG